MNRPTRLLLVRHGQARAEDGSYGRDTPLSALGQAQAQLVASALADCGPAVAVYSSPLPRALQTAQPLCRSCGLGVIEEPRLAEYELDASTLDDALQRPDLVIWHPDHQGVPGGETLGAFCARVGACCDEIVARHAGECVALFAHSGTIEAVLRWALGLPSSHPWQHEFAQLANGSITEIEYWPQGCVPGGAPRYAVFRRIGDVAHLGDQGSDI